MRVALDASVRNALKEHGGTKLPEEVLIAQDRRTDSNKVPVGRALLKYMSRLTAHGVFGPGLTCPDWTLNPARLDCQVEGRRCNDGKCALECHVCAGRVSNPATTIVQSTSTWQKENGPITQQNLPDESTTILLHYLCQCRYAHMKVNDYIRGHPDEDCRWMLESYSEVEWEAVCKASNVVVWTPGAFTGRRA
jgi:hypothetical protein